MGAAAVPGADRAATATRRKRAFVPTVLSSDSLARSIVVITSPPPPLPSASPAAAAEGSERFFAGGAPSGRGRGGVLRSYFYIWKVLPLH